MTTPDWEEDMAGQLARVVLAECRQKPYRNANSKVELQNLAN